MFSDIESRLRDFELGALESFKAGMSAPPVLYREQGLFTKAGASPDAPMMFVASEESPDRMGDVIMAAGWKLDAFRQNPVFMLSHDHSGLPIGKVADVRIEGKQLLASVQFDTADPLSAQVKGKYERGFMKAVSVGFRPLSYEDIADNTGKRTGLMFKEAELLELSAVAVPAHASALLRAIQAQKFYSLPKMEPKTPPAQVAGMTAADYERVSLALRELKDGLHV